MSKRLIPYITMDGNAKEAIEFYKEALDAQLLFIQTFGEMPENPDFPIPAEVKERVGHATLKVGETELMFSDTFPGSPFSSGNQVSICITTDSVEQAQKCLMLYSKEDRWECLCRKPILVQLMGM